MEFPLKGRESHYVIDVASIDAPGGAEMPKSIGTTAHKALMKICKQTRQDAELSQSQLATALRTSQAGISEVERGVRRLDGVELVEWAIACGITPREFFDRYVSLYEAMIGVGRTARAPFLRQPPG